MKRKLTKLVSISYDDPEEKERAIEQFLLFRSTEGTVVRNVKPDTEYDYLFRIGGIFRKKNRK